MPITHHVFHSSVKNYPIVLPTEDENTKVWYTTRRARWYPDDKIPILVDGDIDDDLCPDWDLLDWNSDEMRVDLRIEYCTPLIEALAKLSGRFTDDEEGDDDDKPNVVIHMSMRYMSDNFRSLANLAPICDVKVERDGSWE